MTCQITSAQVSIIVPPYQRSLFQLPLRPYAASFSSLHSVVDSSDLKQLYLLDVRTSHSEIAIELDKTRISPCILDLPSMVSEDSKVYLSTMLLWISIFLLSRIYSAEAE